MGNKVGRGTLLNRTQTAALFGIAATTLDDWVRRGCPVVERGSRGKRWTFNSADVHAWREHDIRSETAGVQLATSDELKRRKLAAETGAAELAYAQAAELVAPVEQIERAMAKAFGEVRANLRNVLPSRAARRLIGETSETRLKAVLLEEVDHALEALADTDLIAEADLDLSDDEDGDED
ncbi:terminase small subunit [Pukyongiella litopenaei]|uniref:Terminase small subunit n=1 Tax=Pukyongiella litopenaei TaxID=2605946 RepID=A0A2S0MNA6_9RHOB|nr:terminase small subunit [Pukyongiella litopenaei]AVO37382.1 terminase small subunit [Pukyongiella litopenaei]